MSQEGWWGVSRGGRACKSCVLAGYVQEWSWQADRSGWLKGTEGESPPGDSRLKDKKLERNCRPQTQSPVDLDWLLRWSAKPSLPVTPPHTLFTLEKKQQQSLGLLKEDQIIKSTEMFSILTIMLSYMCILNVIFCWCFIPAANLGPLCFSFFCE